MRTATLILFGGTDPDAAAWRAAVLANGGSVSAPTLKAVSRFCREAKGAGIWSKLNRVNLMCGDQFSACLVPLKVGNGSTTDASTNFVSGDYSQATGLTGDGTSKSLNTGLAANTFTTANAHEAFYCAGDFFAGSNDAGAGAYFLFRNDATLSSATVGPSTDPAGAATTPTGFFVGSAVSSTDLRLYRFGVQVGPTVSVSRTATLNSLPMLLFARNSNGTVSTWKPGPLRAYSYGSGLSASEVSSYSAIMQEFQTALGRSV